ncbi:MAG: ATP-binding protein [Actinomycetota bacterium]
MLRRGSFLRIEVWDTGRGIPADNLPAYRGDHSKDPGGGLGIGLTIVARTACLLGHSVTVRSRECRGSRFGHYGAAGVTATPTRPTA